MANFSPEVIRLAQESEKKYGVPASVTLAQYATESAYGKSTLAQSAHNYFGMTGSNDGNYVIRNGRKWQRFDSMAESFDKHGQLLAKPLYSTKTKNAKSVDEYIDAIAETYAPTSDGNAGIADLWKKIIRQNNLTQYDSGKYDSAGLYGQLSDSTRDATSPLSDKVQAIGEKFLTGTVKVLSILFLVVLALVFFFNAFDLELPTKKGGLPT